MKQAATVLPWKPYRFQAQAVTLPEGNQKMPWNVSWVDEQETIVKLQPTEPWDWEELEEAIVQYHDLVQNKDHNVDVIYALYRNIKLPNANLIPRVRQYLSNSPSNRGMIVFVDAPRFVETMVGITTKVVGESDKIRSANSVEEAVSIINDIRGA